MKIYGPQITGSLGINGSTIGNFNNLVSTSSFNQYTSSISTGSLATTGSNTFVGNQTISGSIIPAVTNIYDLGDDTHQFRHLYLSSGSLYINGTKVLGATGQELQITTDNGQSLKILEAGSDTITLQSADGNITLATSAGGDVILDPTSGIIALKGTTTLYAGNKILSSDGAAIQIGNDLGITGSIVTTGNINGINLSTFSSSIATQISTIQTNTGSSNARLTSIENKTGSYATTGSNTFFGTQTFTGSVYIANDLIVQGSSSIQYISASSVSIGTNIINLNTATPSIRYAGLSIIDSGSSGVSASLLWDSQTDDFIFTHRSAGSETLDSSMFIYGPLNTGSLDNIVGILPNRLTKGESSNDHTHHITSSQISDDGITVSIPGNLVVTGPITGSIAATNGVVSGSTQLTSSYDARYVLSGSITQTTWDNIASKPGGIVSGSAQTIANLPTGTVSGSSQLTASVLATTGSNTFTGTQTISASLNVSGATNFGGAFAVNDANMNLTNSSSLNLTSGSGIYVNSPGVISGSISGIGSVTTYSASVSAQLISLNTSTSSFETKGRSIVSGSSQIDVMSTTNIAKLATTGSNTFTGNQTITGTINTISIPNDLFAFQFLLMGG
jgi:hypothetical protein